jgi:hypothetical protein
MGNGLGLAIHFSFMVGTTYMQAPNSWANGVFVGTPSQFNLLGTVGNVFELFDISMHEGTVAPPFVLTPFAQEQLACYRYYWRWNGGTVVRFALCYADTTTSAHIVTPVPVPMRASPTMFINGMTVQGVPCTLSGVNWARDNLIHFSVNGSGFPVGAMQFYGSATITPVISFTARL